MTLRTIALILIILLNKFNLMSQQDTKNIEDKKYNRFSIGVNAGVNTAFGDIKENSILPTKEEIRYGFGGLVSYQFNPLFSIQIQGMYGELAGIKTEFLGGNPTDLRFESDLYDIALTARLNTLKLLAPDLSINDFFNFYVTTGLGIIRFRTEYYEHGELHNYYGYDYNENTGELSKTNRLTTAVGHVGLGMEFKVHEKLSVVIESNYRNVVSNKLDGYIRNASSNDIYNYTSLGVIYTFGKKDRPDLRYEEHIPGKRYIEEQYTIINNLAREIRNLEDECCEAPTTIDTDSLLLTIEELNKTVNELKDEVYQQKIKYEKLKQRTDDIAETRITEHKQDDYALHSKDADDIAETRITEHKEEDYTVHRKDTDEISETITVKDAVTKTTETTEMSVVRKTPEPTVSEETISELNSQVKQFIPIQLYFYNDKPDPNSWSTSTNANYKTEYYNYLEKIDKFKENHSKGLTGGEKQAADDDIDLFFNNYLINNYNKLKELAEKIIDITNKDLGVIISLKGFSSPLGTSNYNIILAERRIRSIINYFEQYNNSALKPHINSGRISFDYKAIGDAVSSTEIDRDGYDSDKHIYSPTVSKERRVEINNIEVFCSSEVSKKSSRQVTEHITVIRTELTNGAYTVQIYALSNQIDPTELNINDIKMVYTDGLYKYHVGEFNTYEEAAIELERYRNMGYEDAFITRMGMLY